MATETLLDLIAADAVEYYLQYGVLPNAIGLSESAFSLLGKPERVFNMTNHGIVGGRSFLVYEDQ